MALPKLETPTFFLTVPSTGKEIKYRPFLVKEEKILLISLQDGEDQTIFNCIKQIIENCTFKQVEVDKLTTYDLEYIFLQIRIRSKGSNVDLMFTCQNEIETDGEKHLCDHVNEISIDLEHVKVDLSDTPENKIILDEKRQIGVILKHPTFESSKNIQQALSTGDLNAIYKSLPAYVDTIFEGEKVYDEFTADEFDDFIESMSDEQFGKIKYFFDKTPKLSLDIPVKCGKCGHEETVVLRGLQSFLA